MLPKGKEIAASASCSNSAAAAARTFPQNVISAILSRLPVKTVLRFTCVSTQWRTLVSQQGFISEHLTRSPASLLIHAHKSPNPAQARSFDDILNAAKKAKAALEEARLKYGDETQSQPEEPELQPDGHAIYTYRLRTQVRRSKIQSIGKRKTNGPRHLPIPTRILDFPGSDEAVFKNMEVVGVENGVVCIAMEPFLKKFVLWNPATRSTRSLPDPSIRLSKKLYDASSAGFGFDSAKNAYKVIRIMRHRNMMTPDVAEFLNTRVGVWKRVGQYPGRPTRFWVKRQACDAVVRGVPYWRATAVFNVFNNLKGALDTENRGTLLWFDVRDDVFDLEQCTWVDEKSREMCFGEIRDCLGVALWEKGSTTTDHHGEIEVLVKEGGGWSLKYRVGPFPWVGPFKWNGPPPMVVVVNVKGFFGERGMVQEVGGEGNLILFDHEKTWDRDDSVNGQDSSRKEKDGPVNGQDSSRNEKDDLVNGQDSSRKENDDSVNGQDSSRNEKDDSGQDSSRKEKDDSVNGQDSSPKTKEEKIKDLWSKMDAVINVQDSLPFTLKTMSYRESLTQV